MELRTLGGYYQGQHTRIELPTQQVIKNGILNLDYSSGALNNLEVADRLAIQYCLSEKQRKATRDQNEFTRSRNVRIWNSAVNGAIQDLARRNEIVRPMPATIITPGALNSLIVKFLRDLKYEPSEVEVRDKDNDNTSLLIQIDTKTRQGRGKTFIVHL